MRPTKNSFMMMSAVDRLRKMQEDQGLRMREVRARARKKTGHTTKEKAFIRKTINAYFAEMDRTKRRCHFKTLLEFYFSTLSEDEVQVNEVFQVEGEYVATYDRNGRKMLLTQTPIEPVFVEEDVADESDDEPDGPEDEWPIVEEDVATPTARRRRLRNLFDDTPEPIGILVDVGRDTDTEEAVQGVTPVEFINVEAQLDPADVYGGGLPNNNNGRARPPTHRYPYDDLLESVTDTAAETLAFAVTLAPMVDAIATTNTPTLETEPYIPELHRFVVTKEQVGGSRYYHFTDGTMEEYRDKITSKKQYLTKESFMNTNQSFLDGMHVRYTEDIIPFVFISAVSSASDLHHIQVRTGFNVEMTPMSASGSRDSLDAFFRKAGRRQDGSIDSLGKLNQLTGTLSIANLTSEGKICINPALEVHVGVSSFIYRMGGSLSSYFEAIAVLEGRNRPTPAWVGRLSRKEYNGGTQIRKYFKPVHFRKKELFGNEVSSTAGSSLLLSSLDELMSSSCHYKHYLKVTPRHSISVSHDNTLGSRSLGSFVHRDPIAAPISRDSEAPTSLSETPRDLNPALPVEILSTKAVSEETVIMEKILDAYREYISAAMSKVPFVKTLSIGFNREHTPFNPEEQGSRITTHINVTINVIGAIGISPVVIPRDEYDTLASMLKALDVEAVQKTKSSPGTTYLPTASIRPIGANNSLETHGVVTTRRTLNINIPLSETFTHFNSPEKFTIPPSEVILAMKEKIDDITVPIRHFAEGVTDEIVAEFMGKIGDKVLAFYFDNEKESRLRSNFLTAVDAYRNRFFAESLETRAQDYSEKADKYMDTLYREMESLLEALDHTIKLRDKKMTIISLLPEASSPSHLMDSFSIKRNSLVFKTETGQLAYYKLKLALGSGRTHCHRIETFPAVFSDGVVIASDKTFYKVTTEDLVRGRVLRSSEITLNQALGEFNECINLDGNTGSTRGPRSGNGEGSIPRASDYRECGFSEDIGDDERSIIDLVVQNQVNTLRR